jgi:tetratricopeptide (TPR) repeat protein
MQVDLELGRYSEARDLGEWAGSLLKRRPDDELEATLHLSLAELEPAWAPERKIHELRRALELREKFWGVGSPKLAREQALLSEALLEKGDAAEAAALAAQAVAGSRQLKGGESPETLGWAIDLASAQLELGDYPRALQEAQQAVGLLEKQASPDAADELQGGLQVLGDALRESGRAEEAQAVHQRLLPLLGPADAKTQKEAEVGTRLGEDLVALGRLAEARRTLSQSWAPRVEVGRVGTLLRARHAFALARAQGEGRADEDPLPFAREACDLLRPMAAPHEQQTVAAIDRWLRQRGQSGCTGPQRP